jgi:hypothetical protein
MDVRTERYVKPNNQIISSQGMADFTAWLKTNAKAMKYV